MAASIVTPAPSELAVLANKHLSVTYALIGTVVLVLALMGFGGYLAVKSFENQLAKQEVKDAQYQQDRATFLASLKADDNTRAAQAQRIADLEAQIKARDAQPLPPAVQPGMQPNANAEQVKIALGAVYGVDTATGTPKVEPDGNVALSLPQAQQAISAKVGLDRDDADLRDLKSVNSLLNSANGTLTSDLNSCKDLNTKANKDIDAYKKLAVRSRWQKFLGGLEKAVIFGAGGYVGHML